MSKEETSGSKESFIAQAGCSKRPHPGVGVTETSITNDNGGSSKLDLSSSKERDSKTPRYSYLNNPQTKFGSEVPHTIRSNENRLNAPVSDSAERNVSQVVIDALTLPYRVLKNVIGNHSPQTLYLNGSQVEGKRDVGMDVQSRSLLLNGQTPAERVKTSVTNLLNMPVTRTELKNDFIVSPNDPVLKNGGKEGTDENSMISWTPLLYGMFFPHTPDQSMSGNSSYSRNLDVVDYDAPVRSKSKRVSILIDDEISENANKSHLSADGSLKTSTKSTDLFSAISQHVMSLTSPGPSFDGNNTTRFPARCNLKVLENISLLYPEGSGVWLDVDSNILLESDKDNLRSHANLTTKMNTPPLVKHRMQTADASNTREIISDLPLLQNLYEENNARGVKICPSLEECENIKTSNNIISPGDIPNEKKALINLLHQQLLEEKMQSRRGTVTSARENKREDATGQAQNSHSNNVLQLRSLMSQLCPQQCGLRENETAAKESMPTVISFKEKEGKSLEEIRTEEGHKNGVQLEKEVTVDEHGPNISLKYLINQDKEVKLAKVLPSDAQLQIDGDGADLYDEWELQLRFSDSQTNLEISGTPAPSLRTKPAWFINTKTTEGTPYKLDTSSALPRYTSRSNWSRTPLESVRYTTETQEVTSVNSIQYDIDFDPSTQTWQSKLNSQPSSSKLAPLVTPACEKSLVPISPRVEVRLATMPQNSMDTQTSSMELQGTLSNHSSISSSMSSLPNKFKSVRSSVVVRQEKEPWNPLDTLPTSLTPSSISRSVATTSLKSSSVPSSEQYTTSKDSIDALAEILEIPSFNPVPTKPFMRSMDALAEILELPAVDPPPNSISMADMPRRSRLVTPVLEVYGIITPRKASVDHELASIVELPGSTTNLNSSKPQRPRSASQVHFANTPENLTFSTDSDSLIWRPRSNSRSSATRGESSQPLSSSSATRQDMCSIVTDNSIDDENSLLPFPEYRRRDTVNLFRLGMETSDSNEGQIPDDSTGELNSLLPLHGTGVLQSPKLSSESSKVTKADDSSDKSNLLASQSTALRFSPEQGLRIVSNDSIDVAGAMKYPSRIRFDDSSTDFIWRPSPFEQSTPNGTGPREETTQNDMHDASSGTWSMIKFLTSGFQKPDDIERATGEVQGRKAIFKEVNTSNEENLDLGTKSSGNIPESQEMLSIYPGGSDAVESLTSLVAYSQATLENNADNNDGRKNINSKKDSSKFPWQDSDTLAKPLAAAPKLPLNDASNQGKVNEQEYFLSEAVDDENETNSPAGTSDNKKDQGVPKSNETGEKKSDAEKQGRRVSFKDANTSNEENLDLGTKRSGNIFKPRKMLSINSGGSDNKKGKGPPRLAFKSLTPLVANKQAALENNADSSNGRKNINSKEDSSKFPWQNADTLAKPVVAALANPQTQSPLNDASNQDEGYEQESFLSEAADDENQTNSPAGTSDNNKEDQEDQKSNETGEKTGDFNADNDIKQTVFSTNKEKVQPDELAAGRNESGKKKSDAGDDNNNKQKTASSKNEKERSEDPATGNTISQFLEMIFPYLRFPFTPTLDDVILDTVYIVRGEPGGEEKDGVVAKREDGERGGRGGR